MTEPVIRLKDVSLTLGQGPSKVDVLREVDLGIMPGEAVGIVGPSGSGKTTLLMVLAGLERVDTGEVHIAGAAISSMNEDQTAAFRGRHVGIVFQSFHLIPNMTALENVALAPQIVKKLPKREALQIAEQQLTHVGMKDKLNSYPQALSGGQQQRLAIARALAMEPKLMLFDEATSALDPELVGEVLDTMRMLASEGMTMICVTHEMGFARDVSDRVAYFHQGVMEEIGPPSQIFNNPSSEHTRAFLSKVR